MSSWSRRSKARFILAHAKKLLDTSMRIHTVCEFYTLKSAVQLNSILLKFLSSCHMVWRYEKSQAMEMKQDIFVIMAERQKTDVNISKVFIAQPTCQKRIWCHDFFFFFYLGFLSRTFTIHGTAGEGGGYLFNSSLPLPSLHRRLDISRAITAESSPLRIAGSRTRTGNLWFPSATR